MQEPRHITLSIEQFIKRSWPLLAVGAVLLFITSALLFWFAVSGKGRTASGVVATSTEQVVVSTSTQDLIPRSLDGVLVPVDQSRLQPYAVMVENNPDARPLSGPAKANLVYEVPVEGGLTRFMLVFDATTTVDAIGPVRSARPYFVDFADSLNAVYAHVGGSPAALDQLKAMKSVRGLNEFFNGKYFWRSAKREAPHSTYTRTDLLHEAGIEKKWSEGHFRSWRYTDDEPDSGTSTRRGVLNGPNFGSTGWQQAHWTYQPKENTYQRFEANVMAKDQDGTAVQAKNVVVLLTDGKVLDPEGRLSIRTTGKGKAFLYHNGKRESIMWYRTAGEHLRFETVDGLEATLNRGTTWIEVVIDGTVFSAIEGQGK